MRLYDCLVLLVGCHFGGVLMPTPVADPESWNQVLAAIPQVITDFPLISGVIALVGIVSAMSFLYRRIRSTVR